MKNAILFILCGLACTKAFTQDYHPFIQQGTYRDEFWGDGEFGLCGYVWGARYWFRGDTVVDGQTYAQLLRAGIEGSPSVPAFCQPFTVDTQHYTRVSLLREQVAEQRVFELDSLGGGEILLFDFSLETGDSVMAGNPPKTVYAVETTYETWSDGTSHKKIRIDLGDGTQTYWIAGLGAMYSLWNPLSGMCICTHGFCVQQNGLSLYGNDCATAVDVEIPPAASLRWRLSPNPVVSTLQLRTEEAEESFSTILIFNLLGEVMTERQLPRGVTALDMNVETLPAGAYFLMLRNGTKSLGVRRFQKI